MANDDTLRQVQHLKLDTSQHERPTSSPRDRVPPDGPDRPSLMPLTPQRLSADEMPHDTDSAHAHRPTVSFDPLATTDEGLTRAIGSPVPRQPLSESTTGRSMMQEFSNSRQPARAPHPFNGSGVDAGTTHNAPDCIRSPAAFETGSSRWPLLQTTVDSLAQEQTCDASNQSHVSQAPASSPQQQTSPRICAIPARHTREYGQEHIVADATVESPSTSSFPSLTNSGTLPSPGSRDGQRSRPSQGERTSAGAMRRPSRRTSTRSASGSAKSPASAFLARFSRDSSTARAEPDEDGQAIGDDGEYIIGKQLGYGGFSVVKEVHSLESGQPVVRAVKIVRKQIVGRSEQENERLQAEFHREVSVWRHLRHDNILPLLAFYDTSFATFCIIPMHRSGTLFDLVRARRRALSRNREGNASASNSEVPRMADAAIPIPLAFHYLSQLASALRYLHEDMKVVHRDIKLENCLVTSATASFEDGEMGDLLLCDFGMSEYIVGGNDDDDDDDDVSQDDIFSSSYNGNLQTFQDGNAVQNIGPADTSTNFAGSVPYASPELINAKRPLRKACVDIWALGVLAYTLFTAVLPFQDDLEARMMNRILEGEWSLHNLEHAAAKAPAGVASPSSVIEFVKGCLQVDEAARWNIGDVLQSAFLNRQ